MTAVRHYCLEGRLRAVFFRLSACVMAMSTTGCTLGQGPSVNSLLEGAGDEDISAQAEATEYASLDLEVNGNGGLIILAEQAGDTTYWQFADSSTVTMQDGYLKSTAGLEEDLIDTRISDAGDNDGQGLPWRTLSGRTVYRVSREWKTADGYVHQGQAEATLACEPGTSDVALPLMTRALQVCHETLTWDDGAVTTSTFWRSPEDGRLWAAETQPWPEAPAFEWRIARPW